jgi:hypothetical protein
MFIQYPSLKVRSIYKQDYWGSSVWVLPNRSTTDWIFCIHQILEKKWEYNETVCQLFIDFKKYYVSIRREVLYNIVIDFGVSMTLQRVF